MHLEIRTTTNGRKHHIIIEKVPKLASFPVTFVFRHWNDEHKQGWLWPCSSGRNLRPGCGDGWWFDLAGFGRNLLFVNCDLTARKLWKLFHWQLVINDVEIRDNSNHFRWTDIYGGDLNAILSRDENEGGRRKPRSEMDAFREALQRNGL
ncbi:hypothetical protein V6N13_149013 [Hibiscus sabdariffa]